MQILVVFLLSLFCVFPAQAKCRDLLSASEIDSIYPKVLGLEFNEVYRGRYGLGGERLRSFFDFLEISGSRGADAASVLKSIFGHLHNDTSFVDRFYSSYSGVERDFRASAFKTFEQRVYVLQRVLEVRPLKGNVRLLDALLAVIIVDFHPVKGFREVSDKDLSNRILQMRKDFFEEESRSEDAAEVAVVKPTVPRFARDEIISLPGEDISQVRQRLNSTPEEAFKNAKQKAVLENFDDFGEVPLYAYQIIHTGSGNPYILLNVYQRALEFLEQEVVVPHYGEKNELKGARVKRFIVHLRRALDGSLEYRFGERFEAMAKERFTRTLKELRVHLDNCSNFHELFKDSEALNELNTVFSAVGVDEFFPPQRE